MQYLKVKLITTVLIASASAYSFADRGDRIIDHLDTDGDDLISLEEFHPPGDRGNKLLERADLNGDGAVTLEEAQQAASERMSEHLKKMEAKLTELDADGDGTVTTDEIRAHAFSRIDEDGDGFLSANEFNRVKRHERKRRHRQHRDHHSSD